MEICGDGLISLCEMDIGATKTFLDMNAAMAQGCFGDDPIAWGDKEWGELIDYLVHGLDVNESEWAAMEYRPRIWDDEDNDNLPLPHLSRRRRRQHTQPR